MRSLAVLAITFCNLALVLLVAMPLPRIPTLVLVAGAITSWGFLLLVPGLLGLGIAAVAWVRRRARLAWPAAGVALVVLYCAIAPFAAAWRTAQQQGAELSLTGYFDGVNYSWAPDRDRSLIYTHVAGRQMKMDPWVPAPVPGKLRPAVVWVHGGGWEKGHRSQTPEWNRWLNRLGYAVFDIEYRLAPQVSQLDQIGDVKCAVGWLRERARTYGVDPNHLVLVGSSAGGNLALSAAYTEGDPRAPASCPVADSSVAAVVSLYGPTDMERMISGTELRKDPVVPALMGGSARSAPERYLLGSPARLARASVPPTLLLHGSRDRAVPVAQSRELADRLEVAGADFQYVELPWADHCFDINWGGWGSQIARPVLRRFLDRYTGG